MLPAVLGFAGYTIDRFTFPSATPRHATSTQFLGHAGADAPARPWPAAVIGLVILVVLALAVLLAASRGRRRGERPDVVHDATRLRPARPKDSVPGFNGPLLAHRANCDSPGRCRDGQLSTTVAARSRRAQVSPAVTESERTGIIQVISEGSPQDQSTTELVHRFRTTWFPHTTAGIDAGRARRWPNRIGVDLADTVGQRLPFMFLAILVLSFLLLMLVFRSLLVPLKAVIMNLLSIGAAYGVIVAIFQWGWVKDLVGIGKEGPIEAWVPMMLFAIVFGLSMDYEVFLLSRIKEEYDRTADNATAVAHGLAKTAGSSRPRPPIMICVFGSFVLSDLRVLKLSASALPFAVFIDATLVRLVLVPATMELLGDRNWWLPKALAWLADPDRRPARPRHPRSTTTRTRRRTLGAWAPIPPAYRPVGAVPLCAQELVDRRSTPRVG